MSFISGVVFGYGIGFVMGVFALWYIAIKK